MAWKFGCTAALLLLLAGCGDTEKVPPSGPAGSKSGNPDVQHSAQSKLPTDAHPGQAPTPPKPAVLPAVQLYPKGVALSEGDFAKLLKTPRKKFTVVTVFAADCAPCIEESKHLATVIDGWKKRKINLIGISADVTVERIDKFIKQIGGEQHYPMYIAPWFVENNKVDGTPVLFLFKPDGTLLLKASVDDTPKPLETLQAKLDELQKDSPETTPGGDRDPGVAMQEYTQTEMDNVEDALAEMQPTLDTLATDQPTGGSSAAEVTALEKRYRPLLAQPRVRFGWIEKHWQVNGGTDIASAVVKTDDDTAPGLLPSYSAMLSPARELKNIGGHANWHGTLKPVYDVTQKRCVVAAALVFEPTEAQSAALTQAGLKPEQFNTRLVLWFATDDLPALAQQMIDQPPHE